MKKLLSIIPLAIFLLGCAKDKSPDFAPKEDKLATYNFMIKDPYGPVIARYNLINIVLQGEEIQGSSRTSYPFILSGTDKNSGSKVYITGEIVNGVYSDSYLNIAITKDTTTTFYKDCNNFTCKVQKGKDSKGTYVKLYDFNSCITSSLVSERDRPENSYLVDLKPIIFYQEIK